MHRLQIKRSSELEEGARRTVKVKIGLKAWNIPWRLFIKRAFRVQILRIRKRKKKISTNYSNYIFASHSVSRTEFLDRMYAFFSFSSQLWRLSKSVSLTSVRFDPLSSSLSPILFPIERVFRPLILFARKDLSLRHRWNNAFIVRYLLSSKEIPFLNWANLEILLII